MSIKDELSFGEFKDIFYAQGYGDSFSYDGLQTVFDMADEYGYDADPAAICGDFDEYDSPSDAAHELGIDISDYENDPNGYDWDDEIFERIQQQVNGDVRMASNYAVIVRQYW